MAGSKAEKRLERKSAKEAKALQLSQKLKGVTTPKQVSPLPDLVCPKVPITPKERSELLGKVPKYKEKPSNFDSKMTWCTELSDREEQWGWGEDRQWSEAEWNDEILRELQPLSEQTWSEIARVSTGQGKNRNRRKKHHYQSVDSITTEAKKRWTSLKLDEFDTAYRFRLGGTKRAWGFVCGAHFYLVWYERYHNIYPTN